MAWRNLGSDNVGETGARFGDFWKTIRGQARTWAVTGRGRGPECGERLRRLPDYKVMQGKELRHSSKALTGGHLGERLRMGERLRGACHRSLSVCDAQGKSSRRQTWFGDNVGSQHRRFGNFLANSWIAGRRRRSPMEVHAILGYDKNLFEVE